MSIARAALADTGMVAARESAALEAAYWSQLVGNFAWRARPAPITSYNFSAFSPFHTFPAGHEDGNHWGPAVALLKTSARSPYYFNFHSADLGHSMRSEEHTSELQSLMRISYAVFCLKKKKQIHSPHSTSLS